MEAESFFCGCIFINLCQFLPFFYICAIDATILLCITSLREIKKHQFISLHFQHRIVQNFNVFLTYNFVLLITFSRFLCNRFVLEIRSLSKIKKQVYSEDKHNILW